MNLIIKNFSNLRWQSTRYSRSLRVQALSDSDPDPVDKTFWIRARTLNTFSEIFKGETTYSRTPSVSRVQKVRGYTRVQQIQYNLSLSIVEKAE
jgi:hypothetical protein